MYFDILYLLSNRYFYPIYIMNNKTNKLHFFPFSPVVSPLRSVQPSRYYWRPKSVYPFPPPTARSARWCSLDRPAHQRSSRQTRNGQWSCAIRTNITTTPRDSKRPSTGACSGILCTLGWSPSRWPHCSVPGSCTPCALLCCEITTTRMHRGSGGRRKTSSGDGNCCLF